MRSAVCLLLLATLLPAGEKDRRVALTGDVERPSWADAVAKMDWREKGGKVGQGSAVLVSKRLAITAHHCVKRWSGKAILRFGYDGTAGKQKATRTAVEIVASNAVYGGTYALMHDFLPGKAGITTTFVDITDLEAVSNAVTEKTRAVYTESFSNPTLRVADVPRLAAIAHDAGVPLVVDNTFSPLILSPVDHGADIVVHSITKFISGMSDVIAGAVCGSKEFIESLMDLHEGPLMLLGPTMDPRVAANISLRIPHLPLRMAAHGERALALAERLEGHGAQVCYPGLAAHPDHGLLDELRPVVGELALLLVGVQPRGREQEHEEGAGPGRGQQEPARYHAVSIL